MAVAAAVSQLLDGQFDRIILSRPAVEAGEKLGFLPGDLKEKVDPYLRPLYDSLNDLIKLIKSFGLTAEKRKTEFIISLYFLGFLFSQTVYLKI